MTLKAKMPISFEGGGDLTVNFFVIARDLNIFFFRGMPGVFPGVCPGRG